MSILDEIENAKAKKTKETFVRIKRETHDVLKQLSAQYGISMCKLLHIALKQLKENIDKELEEIGKEGEAE